MDSNTPLFQQVIDDIDQGILYINSENRFQHINRKAREILGVTVDKSGAHPEGHLEPGDIVIIADNAIGYDDGELSPDDLKLLNIRDKNIRRNDMFVGVGVYKNKGIDAVYRHLPNDHLSESLHLNTTYLGYPITSSISASDKLLTIKVGSTGYDLAFMNGSGHMVIIDCITGQVKFFQSRGYSIRKEELRDVLLGNHYLAKGADIRDIDIIDRQYDDILGNGELSQLIASSLAGEPADTSSRLFYINKIIALCSIRPVYRDDRIDGVILKMIDSSEMEQLLQLRNKTIEEMEQVYASTQMKSAELPDRFLNNIIGSSNVIQKLKALAHKATRTNSNIIITGESGTGKSHLAYEIHNICRPGKPFIEVNCSAIPQNLFESELFGYVGGAFTGALSKGKTGYFEMASGGTIFLDEIGELPPDMQVKLLQVLQNKRFYRVGSSTPVNINVRVIAATNKNLLEEVKCGNFRQDLYYRLNVFPITVPPLREHKSDIYLLVNKITRRLCQEYGMSAKQFSGAALNKLLNYDWPGNVRELENVIERAIAISDSDIIFPEYIDIIAPETSGTLKESLQEAERRAIIAALESFGGDKAKAIKSLDISKAGFYEKLKRYKIEF